MAAFYSWLLLQTLSQAGEDTKRGQSSCSKSLQELGWLSGTMQFFKSLNLFANAFYLLIPKAE